jgi:hypothetical protein
MAVEEDMRVERDEVACSLPQLQIDENEARGKCVFN